MFLNGISLENISKFLTDITRNTLQDDQKDHFVKALQVFDYKNNKKIFKKFKTI